MDLCKQGLGPPNVPPLMDALDLSNFAHYFPFGNNFIGLAACPRVA